MSKKREQLYKKCQGVLLEKKEELLNTVKGLNSSLAQEVTGDEGDMAQALIDQNNALSQQERLMMRLKEIDEALERIEAGSYGVCVVTEEPIEEGRLLAMPWTKLSLIGAEQVEAERKRFA